MNDLLAQGSAWLETQRTRFATRQATYQRGAASVELPATIGRTVFQTVNDHSVIERTETRDYLILASHLVLNETASLPQRGDRIVEADGGQTFIYEVLAPGKEPVWRYSDPYRQTLRVHTRHVATENDP